MPVNKSSPVRDLFRFMAFRVIPAFFLAGMLWSGYNIAQAVYRQMGERFEIENRMRNFAGTATAIVVRATEEAPTLTLTPTASHTPTSTATATSSSTNTATPEPTATETPSPSATPTPEPSATEIPLPTIEEGEPGFPVQPAQFGATNTPRPVSFATNTPPSESGQAEAVATATDMPDPTVTATELPPSATPTLAASATPVVEELSTISPLPTLLAPAAPEDGLVIGGTAVPTRVPFVERQHDLVNIVLLGSDDELTGDGFMRTDSIIIVSINRDTHSVSMLSLPRDLLVYIPTPNGMMQRINIAYGVGEAIGYTDGGFGLLRQTIWHNLGINVHYYARVDFDGFRQIIDTIGGIDIAVDCAYQDYRLIGAEMPDGAIPFGDQGLFTVPVGYYHMNGAQALWYARTRRTGHDFDRGRRQQQLLRAIWRKSLDTLTLANAPQLWNQGMDVIETDIGLNEFLSLLPLGLNLDVGRIRSFTLIRLYHTTPWQTPNGDFVQLPVYGTMRPLLEDFYRPPPDTRLVIEGASIEVYNGTDNADWDRVAAESLAWDGFRAAARGTTEPAGQTVLVDHTGQQRGSALSELIRILNVDPQNVIVEPDPNRTADYVVTLGSDYNSCNALGVVAVDE
jgi:polyisoprenyl-teichoic acid--peptidoglycan teichoic acid transferase